MNAYKISCLIIVSVLVAVIDAHRRFRHRENVNHTRTLNETGANLPLTFNHTGLHFNHSGSNFSFPFNHTHRHFNPRNRHANHSVPHTSHDWHNFNMTNDQQNINGTTGSKPEKGKQRRWFGRKNRKPQGPQIS